MINKDYLRYLILKETIGESEAILEDYKTIVDGRVLEIAEMNETWNVSESHEAPFFVIKQKGEKGVINIDFYTTPYILEKGAQEAIRKIFKEMSDRVFKEDPDIPLEEWGPSYSCGRYGGTSPEMLLIDLAEYLPRLVAIVLDKSNWKLHP